MSYTHANRQRSGASISASGQFAFSQAHGYQLEKPKLWSAAGPGSANRHAVVLFADFHLSLCDPRKLRKGELSNTDFWREVSALSGDHER